ncbi:hypothetical protein FVEG_13936 [Fusarium verticillioides 7600]|uniref:Uncharacterized protein n=1 Tax=Gibberella moniliformis (strain M3125 / FGSC 7600) TaxID=334819 RepID=A0A139YBZ1_GIBM7|nr:hypothetical protein FVEG_13936 [Fusarium verticillioides 7600]KYG13675.1 hypothetical protein FVEG_13936 [Fusarium verticillioides 7600]
MPRQSGRCTGDIDDLDPMKHAYARGDDPMIFRDHAKR